MMSVAYFCKATEIRFLTEKNLNQCNKSSEQIILDHDSNKTDNGEFWHCLALKLSCEYLPCSSPIVKHYMSSYSKHFGCNMQDIVSYF